MVCRCTCEWEDAGPSGHDESALSYRHDSGLSRTYEALRVPPGVVRDSLMERLMGPMRTAPRKRVTLLYRPVDAGRHRGCGGSGLQVGDQPGGAP